MPNNNFVLGTKLSRSHAIARSATKNAKTGCTHRYFNHPVLLSRFQRPSHRRAGPYPDKGTISRMQSARERPRRPVVVAMRMCRGTRSDVDPGAGAKGSVRRGTKAVDLVIRGSKRARRSPSAVIKARPRSRDGVRRSLAPGPKYSCGKPPQSSKSPCATGVSRVPRAWPRRTREGPQADLPGRPVKKFSTLRTGKISR